jgi:hypothetical protein
LKSQPTRSASPASGVTLTDHCVEELLLDAFVTPTFEICPWSTQAFARNRATNASSLFKVSPVKSVS